MRDGEAHRSARTLVQPSRSPHDQLERRTIADRHERRDRCGPGERRDIFCCPRTTADLSVAADVIRAARSCLAPHLLLDPRSLDLAPERVKVRCQILEPVGKCLDIGEGEIAMLRRLIVARPTRCAADTDGRCATAEAPPSAVGEEVALIARAMASSSNFLIDFVSGNCPCRCSINSTMRSGLSRALH